MIKLSEDTPLACEHAEILILDAGQKRIATLKDLREVLQASGLDITTKGAVDWSTNYPHAAEHATRICELVQTLDTLKLLKGR